MKKIKVLLLLLIVSLLLSFTITYAEVFSDFVSYLGINIPRLGVSVMLDEENKYDSTVAQSYYNTGTIDNCTGNENGIRVKLKKGGTFTSEITISTGLTSGSWGNDSKDSRTYAPKLRTNSSSICASTHSGIWSHY